MTSPHLPPHPAQRKPLWLACAARQAALLLLRPQLPPAAPRGNPRPRSRGRGPGHVRHHASLTTGPDGKQKNPLLVQYYTPAPPPLDFPPLDDRGSIQIALSMVLRALSRKEILPGQASQYLYCLQIASANLKRWTPNPWEGPVAAVTVDEEGNELAPDEDPAGFRDHLAQIEEQDSFEKAAQNAAKRTQEDAIAC